ncbi:UNVERIFIED_CONTAM: hypothetical protein FKN15_053125 [Acipenser sinensis]
MGHKATAADNSIWQIVFHLPENRKDMTVAQAMTNGYGINTTPTRILTLFLNIVFNVTLGTFLCDVELVKIIAGPETLIVPEANLKGYNVQEHVFPNGSKTYKCQWRTPT